VISDNRSASVGWDFTLPLVSWTKGIDSVFDRNMVLGDGNVLYATNGLVLVRFDTQAGVLIAVEDGASFGRGYLLYLGVQ